MKLKKMLAALTSAALAISTMAFTPLTASAAGETSLFADKVPGAKSVVITYDIDAVDSQAYYACDLIVNTWDSNTNTGDYIKYGLGGADQAKWYGGNFVEYTTSASDEKLVVNLEKDPNANFEIQYKNSSGYEITVKKVEAFDSLNGGGNSVFSWENPNLDTTTYASQTVPLVEISKNTMKLPGVFDLSKVNGPQARLEIKFQTSGEWGGLKILDAANDDPNDPDAVYNTSLAMVQGTDVIGQYTKSIKLSDLGSTKKTLWLNTWSVDSIDSVVIYNDETKGNIYSIPVVDIVPDTVEVTAEKTTEVVGTPVNLEAAVSNSSGGKISVDYEFEWTVDPAEGATVTPGEDGKATLSATKADTYSVTCTVNPVGGGDAYATSEAVKVTFTDAIVDADKVTVTAEKDSEKLGNSVKLTADVASTSGKEVTGKYTLDWTVSGEGATVTASEEDDTAVLSATKAGKYTVTCVLKNGEGTEVAKSTVDVTFTEPVKPDTVKVTADKDTVTEGTPVKFTAVISNSEEKEIDAKYVVEWSVSPEKGAKLTSKDTSASLNASEAGEYTVTCTVKSADGKEKYAEGTAKVTVEAAENPFDLKVEKEELAVGETTTASASRDGKAISVKWTSSNEKIATVDENGVITAVAAGTVTITAAPEDGSPRSVVITVVAATKEYMVTSFVDRMYNIILGREPDSHCEDHINNLLDGQDAVTVTRDFILSPEFLNMGLSNEEVVDRMYMAFLGRTPGEDEKAAWAKRLYDGCSYAHIFHGFTQSDEFEKICEDYGIDVGTYEFEFPRDVNGNLTSFVSRLYTIALDRAYDVQGLDNHTAKYLETGNMYSLAYDFIFSDEFKDRDLNDEDFVEAMYNTFFDRGSDPEGKDGWLKVLADGGSREDVLKGFVYSDECEKLIASFGI